jgi:hypothetical protein
MAGNMRDGEPYSESIGHIDFGGYYLTHAIWHNSYGSYQPETGVRSYAADLKDFRLIEHGCNDWPLVTIVTLAGLSKGWDACRIARIIEWWGHRRRKRARVTTIMGEFDRTIAHLRSIRESV